MWRLTARRVGRSNGGGSPNASHADDSAGDVRADEVVAELDPTGHVCVYAHATTHIVVDVTGHDG